MVVGGASTGLHVVEFVGEKARRPSFRWWHVQGGQQRPHTGGRKPYPFGSLIPCSLGKIRKGGKRRERNWYITTRWQCSINIVNNSGEVVYPFGFKLESCKKM
jgi:hypothetical protein